MKWITLIIVCFIYSCGSIIKATKVDFTYYASGEVKKKLRMHIPKGAKLVRLEAGGEGKEHRYWYSDSSVIYISSLDGSATINESYINKNIEFYNRRFKADTASFSGIDMQGRFWREVKKEKYVYGYSRVPNENRKAFDSALNSLH